MCRLSHWGKCFVSPLFSLSHLSTTKQDVTCTTAVSCSYLGQHISHLTPARCFQDFLEEMFSVNFNILEMLEM